MIKLTLIVLLFSVQSFGQTNMKKENNKYYNLTSVSLLGGSALSGSFQIVNGYEFNKHWAAGLGIGVENFYGQNYFPLFIDSKYTLLDQPFSPFCSVNLGYDLPTENFERNKGGFMGTGRIGIQHQLGNHFGLITSAGYRYAYIKQNEWAWWGNNWVEEIREINRFEFRFGFIFR